MGFRQHIYRKYEMETPISESETITLGIKHDFWCTNSGTLSDQEVKPWGGFDFPAVAMLTETVDGGNGADCYTELHIPKAVHNISTADIEEFFNTVDEANGHSGDLNLCFSYDENYKIQGIWFTSYQEGIGQPEDTIGGWGMSSQYYKNLEIMPLIHRDKVSEEVSMQFGLRFLSLIIETEGGATYRINCFYYWNSSTGKAYWKFYKGDSYLGSTGGAKTCPETFLAVDYSLLPEQSGGGGSDVDISQITGIFPMR